MTSPLMQIRSGAISLGLILVISTIAFRFLGDYDWLEAMWMVVITISTVGYSEQSSTPPTVQLLMILVILTGVSAAAYTCGGFVQLMLQGEVDRVFGNSPKMNKEISKLENHVIICGGGRLGQDLMAQLQHRHIPFVVVDADEERVHAIWDDQAPAFVGDATQEQTLQKVGLERAQSLVTALPTDADNVFITLSARNLRPDIQIIAKAEHESSCRKLRQAGANKIVMPHRAGAQQMERMISRPTTADLVELFAESSHIEMEIDEFQVADEHALVGQTIEDIKIDSRFQLIVVGLKSIAGDLRFKPAAAERIAAGDTLVVMGDSNDIQRLKRELKL